MRYKQIKHEKMQKQRTSVGKSRSPCKLQAVNKLTFKTNEALNEHICNGGNDVFRRLFCLTVGDVHRSEELPREDEERQEGEYREEHHDLASLVVHATHVVVLSSETLGHLSLHGIIHSNYEDDAGHADERDSEPDSSKFVR